MYGYTLRVKALELKDGIKMPPMDLGLYRLENYSILFKTMEFALNEDKRVVADSGPLYFDRYQMGMFVSGQIPIPLIGQRVIGNVHREHRIAVVWRCVTRFFRLACLSKLGSEHIDMYLIHFGGVVFSPGNPEPLLQDYLAIVKVRDISKIIGITHFTMENLREFTDVMAFGLLIEKNNQVEYHPHHVDAAMIKFCIFNNMLFHTAHFFREMSFKNTELLIDPIARKIASKYRSSPTEVLLAWALQHGIAIIAKTTKVFKSRGNTLLNLKLSSKDMKALNALGIFNKKNSWDPKDVA